MDGSTFVCHDQTWQASTLVTPQDLAGHCLPSGERPKWQTRGIVGSTALKQGQRARCQTFIKVTLRPRVRYEETSLACLWNRSNAPFPWWSIWAPSIIEYLYGAMQKWSLSSSNQLQTRRDEEEEQVVVVMVVVEGD